MSPMSIYYTAILNLDPIMTIETHSTYDKQYSLATNCKIMSPISNYLHLHSNLPDITHVATYPPKCM